jgi:hypothetical protein
MDRRLRALFNQHWSPDFYRRYIEGLERALGCSVPFRVAESPLFMTPEVRAMLAKAATEIVDLISAPSVIAQGKEAIPARYDVPGLDGLAGCIQVDFALCDDGQGGVTGKVVELQGFPSLYALMVVQTEVLGRELAKIPGMPADWSLFYSGLDRAGFVERFRRALLAGNDPEEVVLLDLDPIAQKTYPDFAATKMLTGVGAVAPESLIRDGRRLLRKRDDGTTVQVKRIYNRIVYDELEVKGAAMPFAWTDDLDVSWVCHPNWYWIWSKHTLPRIDHPAVPRARYVNEVDQAPEDMSRYVLKPLFSFAGSGVKVEPTRADFDGIPAAQRHEWILQEKIQYAPVLHTPEGHGVKAEVRMMFLRQPDEPKPQLVLNLVRMSRGVMLGVDQNKQFDWVGGSVGIWPTGT